MISAITTGTHPVIDLDDLKRLDRALVAQYPADFAKMYAAMTWLVYEMGDQNKEDVNAELQKAELTKTVTDLATKVGITELEAWRMFHRTLRFQPSVNDNGIPYPSILL